MSHSDAEGDQLFGLPAVFSIVALAVVFLLLAGVDPFVSLAGLQAHTPMSYLHCLMLSLDFIGPVVLILMRRRMRNLHRRIARLVAAEAGAHGSARIDPLTSLANRRALKEHIDRALERLWPGFNIAVLLIDLDGFKAVNDIHGHEFGDQVLRETAARLRAALPFGAFIARLGGDEFAVILPCSLSHRSMDTAAAVVAAMAEKIQLGEVAVALGASVGVAHGPQDGADTPTLLRAADIAMYRAKEAGRGRAQRFLASMEEEIRALATLKAELRHGIGLGQIVPYYQPIVDLVDGRIVEFEVLARWRHPDHGLLTPDRFIHLVESVNQATPLLVSLLRQVARDVRAWPQHLRFAVNVFPSQMLDAALIGAIVQASADGGLSSSRLCIEVTEGALVQDVDRARTVIDAAHKVGMTVALDDFGTGYSSLYHMRELPFDRLKIDRSFVQSIAVEERNTAYVALIITLCETLNIEVTAEGIETAEIGALLREMRCDFGQGYLYGKPVTASDAEELLAAEPPCEVIRLVRAAR